MEKQRLDLIIEELDPEGRLISGSLSLECCTLQQGDKISKDLRILNRDLRDTVILECEVASVVQVNNVVPVVPVWGEEDKELMELERFLLREVARCGDVRDLCRGWFRL
jgi:TFIIF-interacting CTD phosphatase-like protein